MDIGPPPPPPGPPPPPPLSGNQSQSRRPAPQPGFAALPFSMCSPTQETNPPPQALHDAQDEENPPLLQVEDGPLNTAVQETDPAPQTLHHAPMTEEEDEAATHMEPAGDDQEA